MRDFHGVTTSALREGVHTFSIDDPAHHRHVHHSLHDLAVGRGVGGDEGAGVGVLGRERDRELVDVPGGVVARAADLLEGAGEAVEASGGLGERDDRTPGRRADPQLDL